MNKSEHIIIKMGFSPSLQYALSSLNTGYDSTWRAVMVWEKDVTIPSGNIYMGFFLPIELPFHFDK